MKTIKIVSLFAAILFFSTNFAQQKPDSKKISISGKIVEKSNSKPLEYATVTLINVTTNKVAFGGITDNLGQFSIDANVGTYNIKIEYLLFKPFTIANKNIQSNTDLGSISLSENPSQLDEVVVRAENSTVEIKLDKKVYNVGKDMIVKGGTASDVLQNVPSVTVDSDGNVSLRGNDNVKIFIDGRPSNAINIATALQTISADAIDKIEVISNPSARYDAEGGAGILNIVLKKGKTNGLNGTIIGTVGQPQNYNLQTALNFKTETFNFFSNFGFIDNKAPGNFLTDSNYFNTNGDIVNKVNERRTNERLRKGHNYNFGIALNLDQSTTWSNAINFRKNDGENPENVILYNFTPTANFVRNRFNDQFTVNQNVEYSTNFTKKFKKEGHKLTADFSASDDLDNDSTTIFDTRSDQPNNLITTRTKNFQSQYKQLFQTDYVLPFAKASQIEMGFKNDINKLKTDYAVGNIDNQNNYTPNNLLTNIFNYKENISAGYVQFGTKIKKVSFLTGLRFEDSKIDIQSNESSAVINKHYQNIFPSAFLTYSLSDNSSISLNYSKRITRPRNRFINPFAGINSDLNIFQGNPDINPSLTDAIDFGVLTKIKKITFTSSLYVNRTKNPFQFVRRPNGDLSNGVPVLLSTPINLDLEERIGLELTANFSPYKWWKINSNFNIFKSNISGDYSYVLSNSNQLVNDSFSTKSSNWFVKVNSKISLPYKIDWQTNGIYTAPQITPQGQSLAVYTVNLAFSKDVFKDKATVTLNISDLFNSTKMIRQFNLATVDSYTEMQRKVRQINLSFTYRFNKKKTERETKPRSDEGGGGDF